MHVTHLTPGSHRAPVFSLPYQRRGVPHSQRPPAPLQGSGTIRGSRHVLPAACPVLCPPTLLQVKAEGVSEVTKVVGVSKLRTKFKQ